MTDELDLLALHLVGGRLNQELSRAREARFYGDPANHVEFPAERERQRKAQEAKRQQKLKIKGKRKGK